VRAYMLQREGARRPPPTPEEVRRQLGWRLVPAQHGCLQFHAYLVFPAALSQLAALMALDWIFNSLRKK
jgi:hypothetical protein